MYGARAPLPPRFRNLRTITVQELRVVVAETVRARLLGLAGLASLPVDVVIALQRCKSIHTFGMRFPIGAAFVARDGQLLAVRASVPPGRVTSSLRASLVLEWRAGAVATSSVAELAREVSCALDRQRLE